MVCRHQPKSPWRDPTRCVKCGQRIESNGPFWMRPSFYQWLFFVVLTILRSHRLLPWIDALHPFWATLGLLIIADIPATAIMLIYRRYFAPYEVIEDPSARRQYL